MRRQLKDYAATGFVVLLAALAAAPARAAAPGIEALAERIVAGLEQSDLKAVGVYDFTDLRGQPTELGRFVAEELSSALVAAAANRKGRRIRVIDRLRLAQLLAERKLVATGLTAQEDQLRKVAAIAGVDGLVTGRITPFADSVHVAVKVLRAGSAEALVAEEVQLAKTPSLAELQARVLMVAAAPDPTSSFELTFEGPPQHTLETNEFVIELKGCARVGTAVHCLLAVTALGQDRSISLNGGTRIVLPNGLQVPAAKVRIGTSEATGQTSRAGATVVRDLPVATSATFEGVPEGVDAIQLLELDLYGDNPRFHDVPIERP
jgi:hypothetical protein